MFSERWKFVDDYEGLYLISDHGRIMALYYGGKMNCKILKLTCTRGRYIKVTLRSKDNVFKTHWLHRLVAQAFLPNPEGKPEVDHLDGDRCNNVASNLRWVDHAENENNPNTKWKKGLRYHREGEFERRSAGQKRRFQRPEERAKLLVNSAKGREVAKRNRELRFVG